MKFVSRNIAILIMISLTTSLFAGNMSDSVNCKNLMHFSWLETVDGQMADAVNSVSSDYEGNIFVAGYFTETVSFGGVELNSQGEKDIFIAKYSESGDLIWAKSAGGHGNDEAKSIACLPSGDICVVGSFSVLANFGDEDLYAYGQQDGFVACYNTHGELKWVKNIGGWNNDIINSVAVNENGNIAIAGTFDGAMVIDNVSLIGVGAKDILVAYLNEDGDLFWAKNFGSVSNEEASSVSFGKDERIIVAGNFSGNMQINNHGLVANGGSDGFVAVFDYQGNTIWANEVGTNGAGDKVNSASADKLGNVYVAGYFDHYDQKAFVRKFDENGSIEWTILTGGDANTRFESIICDADSYLFAAGYFSGTAVFETNMYHSLGNNDAFILKLNPNGDIVDNRVYGSSGNDQIFDINLDYKQSLLVAGLFSNSIEIEGETQVSQGQTDGMLFKFQRPIIIGDIFFTANNCSNDDLCVEINMLQGVEPLNFYWSTGDNEQTLCNLSPATYWLTVVDAANCYIDTVLVTMPVEMPIVNLPTSIDICYWDTITIDAGIGFAHYEWSTGSYEHFIELTEAGTYTLTVSNEFECQDVISIDVVKSDNKILFPQDTVFTCPSIAINLSPNASFDAYWWSTGANSPEINSTFIGEHSLIVREGDCYYYDTIVVQNYPQPKFELGDDRLICSGDIVLVSVDDVFEAYLWSNGSTESFVNIGEAGVLSLTVTDVNGCQASDSILISLGEYPNVNLGEDKEFCESYILDINAGEGFTSYLWSTGETTQSISPTETGIYSVTVINSSGCQASDSVQITIFPIPIINIGDDIIACAYDSVVLSANNSFAYYYWSNGAQTSSIHVVVSGDYSLTVVDSHSCSASDNVNVLISEPINVSLGEDKIQCDSLPVLLTTNEIFYSYLWQNGSVSNSFNAVNQGLYSVTVSDEYGCSGVASVQVSHAPSPVLELVFVGTGKLEVEADLGTPPFVYSIDQEVWTTNNVFLNLLEDWYTVWVSDENACSDSVHVFVDNYIIIPDFFTPNADGYNDTWEIPGLFKYPKADIMVFDRYGKMVAKYKASESPWDGTYLGNPLPSDTYWYIIKLNSDQPINQTYKGSVTIKR